jgi:hypothetical protein
MSKTAVPVNEEATAIGHSDWVDRYGHIWYPVGGFRSYDLSSTGNDSTSKKPVIFVPADMNPSEASGSETKEVTPSSRSTTKPVTIVRETIVTIPKPNSKNVPAIPTTTNGNHDHPTLSENARNFLKKIPDLSYMLSSKLTVVNGR